VKKARIFVVNNPTGYQNFQPIAQANTGYQLFCVRLGQKKIKYVFNYYQPT
jgi:hypothetical protein